MLWETCLHCGQHRPYTRVCCQGLQQLSTDVDAVAALFGSFTRRPLAHFRELDEARRLLLLPPAEAAGLQAALQQEQGGQQARQALAAINCTRLNDVQAMAVLMALQPSLG